MSATPAREEGAEAGEASARLRLSSSPSAGGWTAELPEEGGGGGESQLRAAAAESEARLFALCLAPETGEEDCALRVRLNVTTTSRRPLEVHASDDDHTVKKVEESVEEMLIRLEEFCGMTDMIRSDTSQLLDEAVPLIKAKVLEMNNIYTKVDKLEAFVKMAGHHISFLEEQVLQAESAHGIFPCAVQKLFGSVAVPSFKKTLDKLMALDCCLTVGHHFYSDNWKELAETTASKYCRNQDTMRSMAFHHQMINVIFQLPKNHHEVSGMECYGQASKKRPQSLVQRSPAAVHHNVPSMFTCSSFLLARFYA